MDSQERTGACGCILILLIALVLGFGALSEFVPSLFDSPPLAVIRKAYMAANCGEYDKAQTFMSSDVRSFITSADMVSAWQLVTRNGTISDIRGESKCWKNLEAKEKSESQTSYKDGSFAEVEIRLTFTDGRVADEKVYLVKENGDWRIN